MLVLLLGLLPGIAAGLAGRGRSAAAEGSLGAFISDNGLFCAQSDPRTAEGALALKKAGPYGKLFKASKVRTTGCEALGFELSYGEDVCYVGVEVFFRDRTNQSAFARAEVAEAKFFAKTHNFTEDNVTMMAACSCHTQSQAARAVDGACASLEAVRGSWTHTDPRNKKELICLEGPVVDSVRSLASLKCSVQMPMHPDDQVKPRTCASRGFKKWNPSLDHCYPRLQLFTRTLPLLSDWGIQQSMVVENDFFKGGNFTVWAKARGLNHMVLQTHPGCNCIPGSEVSKNPDYFTYCAAPTLRPAVNDWYLA